MRTGRAGGHACDGGVVVGSVGGGSWQSTPDVRPARFRPTRAHLFVCVNQRSQGDPLGRGCGARGDEVYAALRREINGRGLVSSVYLTRTHCLSVCPAQGTAVAISPGGQLLADVTVADVPALIDAAAKTNPT